ncbi:MAG: 4'-phosphopantetheinyl transferase superfamily protein [Verrucomicrobiales bacterium]|nr:4'-phosphopantetheinyl transferase superfamily protein [Verrucomicrobiales bacterium]
MSDVDPTKAMFRVWSVSTGAVPPAAWDILSASERANAARFVHDADRESYVAAHAALRVVLSQVLQIVPHWVQFARTPAGRPFVVHPDPGNWDFNLSHTRGRALVALRRGGLVGVDVERLDPERSASEVSLVAVEEMLSAEELSVVQGCDPERRRRFLLEAWVAREAFAKACGAGITRLDLRRVVPDPLPTAEGPAQERVRLRVPREWERGSGWTLQRLATGGEDVAAVAYSGVDTPSFADWDWGVREPCTPGL